MLLRCMMSNVVYKCSARPFFPPTTVNKDVAKVLHLLFSHIKSKDISRKCQLLHVNVLWAIKAPCNLIDVLAPCFIAN